MSPLHYTISQEIFERFPGYVRGVVVATDVRNGASPDELVQLLRREEDALRARLDINRLTEHPAILSWREAFRAFGAKPSEFRSSTEAMARRALRGDPLPSINRLVDIGNVVSLRHLIPAGAHAIDVLEQDIALRFASGEETFIPLGSEISEQPLPGEVIYAEGNTVLTRRWTWRQGTRSLAVSETRAVEFNIDGLPPATLGEVEQACGDIVELLACYCGGAARYEILSADHPTMRL